MPLTLEIVSEHKALVGDDAVRVFDENGGTIGRSLQNDWILPDPDRYISGKHATIDCKGGVYYLADISSNGVYVNDEPEPIGRGNPRRLFNGDRLHFGDFEVIVTIDEGEDLEMPEPPKPTVAPDHIEQMVDEESLKTGVALLDEEEITGDEVFQSVMFGSGSKVTKLEDTEFGLDYEPLQKPQPAPEPAAAPAAEAPVPKPRPTPTTDEGLLAAFLEGLGVARDELHPAVDIENAMRNAGEVLREYVAGTHKLLASRADLKTAFRLDQTAILPSQNNPLKLSQNTDDSVKQLLVGREGEYLGPRDSVREICRDLLAHQDAFLDAMTTAFVDFAERFDPDELAESFDNSAGGKAFFKFLQDGRYWQMYKDLYPVITEKGGGRFPQTFAEEFVKAYERAVAEALRVDRPFALGETQKLDRTQSIKTLTPADDVREPTIEEEIAALPDPEQAEG